MNDLVRVAVRVAGFGACVASAAGFFTGWWDVGTSAGLAVSGFAGLYASDTVSL